jgi:hypothetical protein
MSLIFPSLAADMISANSPMILVQDGVSDAVPDGVPDSELKTMNCSQSILNFKKQPMQDLIGHITHKTHVSNFLYSTLCSHTLRFKLASCNSVGRSTE